MLHYKPMKPILLLLFVLLFSNLVIADSIGVFKIDTDIELYQTCNNCTYCNLTTIKYPNSTNIITNTETTRDNSYFYFNLGKGNVTQLGNYKYCYDCGNGIDRETGCISFEVTPNGFEPNNSQGLIYSVLFIVALVLFLTSIFLAVSIDGKKYDTDSITGQVTGVNWGKYYKYALWFFAYIILIWLSHLAYEISAGILYTEFLKSFFHMAFRIELGLLLPITFLFFFMVFVSILRDKKNQSLIERGLQP